MSFTYISEQGDIVFPSEHNIENNKGKYCVKFYIVQNYCGHSVCYFMAIKDSEKEKIYVTAQIESLKAFAKKFHELKSGRFVI